MISQRMTTDQESLGMQYRLGNYRTTCQSSTICSSILTAIRICLIGSIGIVITGLGIGLFLGNIPEIVSHLFIPLLGLVLPIAILTFLYGMYEAIRYCTLRVFIYDDGLIHISRESLRVISWQNVRAVRHNMTTVRTEDTSFERHTYTIICMDGTELTLDDKYKKREQVWKIIEERIARHLFPAALKAYQTSQTIAFGPLMVIQEGISYEGKILPWSELGTITITKTVVIIKKQGKWFSWARVKLGVVPNPSVFKLLVSHITG